MNPSARLAVLRLLRSRRSLLAAGGWFLLALVGALVEHAHPARTAAHVLLGTFGAIALPLLVFVLVGAALAGQGLGRAGRPLVAFGESAAVAAGATILVCVGVATALSGILSGLVASLAHGAGDPPLVSDVLTSAWVGALAGATYAAYFGFGAAILRNGAGRVVVLGLDWVLGGDSASGVLTPRAHLRSLFGGTAPLGMSQRASTIALVLLLAVYAWLAIALARRTAR